MSTIQTHYIIGLFTLQSVRTAARVFYLLLQTRLPALALFVMQSCTAPVRNQLCKSDGVMSQLELETLVPLHYSTKALYDYPILLNSAGAIIAGGSIETAPANAPSHTPLLKESIRPHRVERERLSLRSCDKFGRRSLCSGNPGQSKLSAVIFHASVCTLPL